MPPRVHVLIAIRLTRWVALTLAATSLMLLAPGLSGSSAPVGGGGGAQIIPDKSGV